MKRLILIALVLASGIILMGCEAKTKTLSGFSATTEKVLKGDDPIVVPSPIANQSITVASQKALSLPLVRESLNIGGMIREDRWGPDFQKIWRFEHEFAQDIYQKFGVLTVRVKLTNVSGEILLPQSIAPIKASWINRQGQVFSPEEIVVLGTIVNPMEYPYPPVKPGQTIILEPFNRLAGQQVIQEGKSYEVYLLSGVSSGNIDERLVGNLINGFYKETASAKEKIAVVHKAGMGRDSNLKAYIGGLNNTPGPVIGKIFFNWLDDKMNPLGKTEIRNFLSTREIPRSSSPTNGTDNFEFSTALNSGAKSYEFWIEVTDGK